MLKAVSVTFFKLSSMLYSHIAYNFKNVDIVILKILLFFFHTVRKDVKDETDNRMQQFKKKAKELRILDPKTAQNLCKYIKFKILLLFKSILQPVTTGSKPLVHEVRYSF